MKVFLKVVSIILIVLGALNIIGSIFLGLNAEVYAVLFGTAGIIYVILNCASSIVAFGAGICGCNGTKIPKTCFILGIILGLISLVIIGLDLFLFKVEFTGIIPLIVTFALSVLYLIPIIKLKKEA